ncbi:MAG: hydroxyacid dehydrogenase [Ruminococcaceae bacterium]|nr:hydroxyacid dehydrogenase [Oscillospiraceae bacterium]
MQRITVLVTRPIQNKIFTEEQLKKLGELGVLSLYDRDDFADRKHVLDFVKDSNVIITSWQTPMLDNEILDLCPELLGVIHGAGSVKDVIGDDVIQRELRVTASANEISRGVAETTLGIAIAACKGFFWLPQESRDGLWRENFCKVTDFYGLKIGVIGAGYAGRHFIKLLKSFCVEILVYDPYVPAEQIIFLGAEKLELDALMSQCDVISVHAPSIPETDNMINRNNLKLLKEGAVLINTSRGSLINEEDLIAECKKRNITAVLDVTAPEPPAQDSELRKLPNIHLLQHTAGVTNNGSKRIGRHVCEEAQRLLSGEKMKCELDLSRLSTMA